MMKVFMTGGSGFVGTSLTRLLRARGWEVTILTRRIDPSRAAAPGVRLVEGDPTVAGPWQLEVLEHDVIVNLAGASIFRRWTESVRQAIRDSRILTTQNLVEAFKAGDARGKHLLSTSAVGYYGACGDEELNEDSPAGDDFLAGVTREWEAVAMGAEACGVRVVRCRFGVVLGRKGGALGMMLPLFRNYLGSPLGDGRQWFAWIHEADLVHIYLFLMEHPEITGAINCTAPVPVRNAEFTRTLLEVLDRPAILPAVPGFLVRLAMGAMGDLVVKGQRVLPRRLAEAGFQFQYPQLGEALRDLLGAGVASG